MATTGRNKVSMTSRKPTSASCDLCGTCGLRRMAGREIQMLKSKVATLECELEDIRGLKDPQSSIKADLQRTRLHLTSTISANAQLEEQNKKLLAAIRRMRREMDGQLNDCRTIVTTIRSMLHHELGAVRVEMESLLLRSLLPALQQQQQQRASKAQHEVHQLKMQLETMQENMASNATAMQCREHTLEQAAHRQQEEISTLQALEQELRDKLRLCSTDLTQANATEATLRDEIRELQMYRRKDDAPWAQEDLDKARAQIRVEQDAKNTALGMYQNVQQQVEELHLEIARLSREQRSMRHALETCEHTRCVEREAHAAELREMTRLRAEDSDRQALALAAHGRDVDDMTARHAAALQTVRAECDVAKALAREHAAEHRRELTAQRKRTSAAVARADNAERQLHELARSRAREQIDTGASREQVRNRCGHGYRACAVYDDCIRWLGTGPTTRFHGYGCGPYLVRAHHLVVCSVTMTTGCRHRWIISGSGWRRRCGKRRRHREVRHVGPVRCRPHRPRRHPSRPPRHARSSNIDGMCITRRGEQNRRIRWRAKTQGHSHYKHFFLRVRTRRRQQR
eukprot:m.457442 g.457442  ORF g.457442 m.457442 type:complete len:573 (-) comp21578_c0_seq7:1059-2777(-)